MMLSFGTALTYDALGAQISAL